MKRWKTNRPLVLLFCLQLLTIWVVHSHTAFFKKKIPEIRGSFFCEGRIFRPAEFAKEGTTLWVDLIQCGAAPEFIWKGIEGRVRLRVRGEAKGLETGDILRFKASLHPPHDFQNPGSFPSTTYFESQGIDALGFVSEAAWITRLPSPPPHGVGVMLETIRHRLKVATTEAMEDAPRGFLLSLLVGDRSALGVDGEEAFRKAGVSHILSISGLHVTMVSLIFLGLFRLLAALPIFSGSVVALRVYPLITLIPVWLYVAVAQFPVSAVRAAVMASLFLISLSIWRRLDLLSSLALAAFFILALSPLSLFSASFQLSFVAVAFLILFLPFWQNFRGRWWFLDTLSISVISMAGVGPLLFYHFHELSIVGILSNVVIVPLVNFFVMPLGMAGWILSGLLGLKAAWVWQGAGWFSQITLRAVNGFAAHSDWGIFNGAIPFWKCLFYYAALLVFLIPKKRFATKWKLALSGVLMAMVSFGGKMSSHQLKVTFVDVGQGDCTVVQLPNGNVWVVDGGGIKGSDWDIGRFVVAPFLWEEGIHRVEYLFLTHPHHDHYKGLGFLAEKFHPKILFTNGDEAPEAEAVEWQDFLSRVEKGKVLVQKITRDTKPMEEAGVRLEFLAPGSQGPLPHFDTNDNSAVMKLTFKNIRFLLPGDLMEAGEQELLESKPDLKAEVLKLGHHGSDTSTKEDFLKGVSPKYAVISVGAFNTYGMPDPPVLDRLSARQIKVFRTDTQGAVTFETDGEELQIKTFVPVSE